MSILESGVRFLGFLWTLYYLELLGFMAYVLTKFHPIVTE